MTRRWLACLLVCTVALGAAATGGCSRWNPAEAKKDLEKLKEKKPEPPFEQLRVFTEPNERSSLDPRQKENRRIITAIKPGHWTGVLVQTKANRFDFSGRLMSEPQDSQQRPIDLESSRFRLSTSRVVALAKGQRKTFETLFFAPRPGPEATSPGSTWIGNSLYDARGQAGPESSDHVAHMPSFQYYMVVLAREAGHYRYLKVLDSVRPPLEFTGSNVEDASYYRVLFPNLGERLALPTHPLCWTSIAYVVWDDVLPGALVPEQQRAMVDWLHWGGGLIISGPDSLDKLRGTFLDRYLPATGASAGPLGAAKIAELDAHWTIRGDKSRPPGTRPNAPWSGVELLRHPEAVFLPGTGELVAERRVGRGRVVVTAFRLSEPDLVIWRSYDSFFNACILRRPPREFTPTRDRFEYIGPHAPDRFDPEIVTGVRFFTRDAREPPDEAPDRASLDKLSLQVPEGAQLAGNQPPAADASMAEAEADLIDRLKAESGVAGWNDFGWISNAARETLEAAAGISVPPRTFVLQMIGFYLLVVVGVNWLVFRLAGRVEWAWLALPAIAVGWGVLVVWLAQLDIGFARSETEVAVLEMQPGYGRGHLTRYTALYSSLSTSYDVRFDEPSAVAQPFSLNQQVLYRQSSSRVTFSTVGDHDLTDYPVTSNSTGMIHSEQMFDTGGGIAWDSGDGAAPTVENNTKLKLSGAVVIRRRVGADGRAVDESAWLGDLAPGGKVAVQFRGHNAKQLAAARKRDSLSADNRSDAALSLRRLIDCAEDHRALEPGEARLVASYDGGLGGMQVSPAASQVRRATLLVAHLQFGAPEPPRPDANLRAKPPPPDELF
ncbi:MAG: hypothetical protein WD063_02075 [Pirellulales bacterium]